MNREREAFKSKDICDANSHLYNKAIDIAFNYFEEKTCENCELFEGSVHLINMIKKDGNCLCLYINVRKTFGCNQFEEK